MVAPAVGNSHCTEAPRFRTYFWATSQWDHHCRDRLQFALDRRHWLDDSGDGRSRRSFSVILGNFRVNLGSFSGNLEEGSSLESLGSFLESLGNFSENPGSCCAVASLDCKAP